MKFLRATNDDRVEWLRCAADRVGIVPFGQELSDAKDAAFEDLLDVWPFLDPRMVAIVGLEGEEKRAAMLEFAQQLEELCPSTW